MIFYDNKDFKIKTFPFLLFNNEFCSSVVRLMKAFFFRLCGFEIAEMVTSCETKIFSSKQHSNIEKKMFVLRFYIFKVDFCYYNNLAPSVFPT